MIIINYNYNLYNKHIIQCYIIIATTIITDYYFSHLLQFIPDIVCENNEEAIKTLLTQFCLFSFVFCACVILKIQRTHTKKVNNDKTEVKEIFAVVKVT